MAIARQHISAANTPSMAGAACTSGCGGMKRPRKQWAGKPRASTMVIERSIRHAIDHDRIVRSAYCDITNDNIDATRVAQGQASAMSAARWRRP